MHGGAEPPLRARRRRPTAVAIASAPDSADGQDGRGLDAQEGPRGGADLRSVARRLRSAGPRVLPSASRILTIMIDVAEARKLSEDSDDDDDGKGKGKGDGSPPSFPPPAWPPPPSWPVA